MITIPEVSNLEMAASRLVPTICKGAPNLRTLANDKYADAMPAAWPLSSGRAVLTPLHADASLVHRIATETFDEFEETAAALVRQKPEVSAQLLSGVDVDPTLRDEYIYAAPFSVRRLDVLQTAEGPLVTENDEQPGGLGIAYLYDRLYGLNHERWHEVWKHLTAEGKLVFVVSDDWSIGYHAEIRWLVKTLKEEGYDAEFLSTAELHRLTVRRWQVQLDDSVVGTVFRLFPIFEASDKLAELVQATKRGAVRLVPEFASWGNKTWGAIFYQYQEFFRRYMSKENFTLLEGLLPQTTLVQNGEFVSAFSLEDTAVESIEQLGNLPKRLRRKVVVKVTGANRKAARSYGVRVGSSFNSGADFKRHLELLQEEGLPFVVQAYRKGQEFSLPAYSVLDGQGTTEMFRCRMLMRPWSIFGVNAGIVTASPATSSLIHGTTASAFVPMDLGYLR